MAYEVKKPDEQADDRRKQSIDTYGSLASEPSASPFITPQQVAGPTASPNITAGQMAYMPGAAPTTTGHVNFDSIYNANAGTAERGAKDLANRAQQKAQGARTGLTGAQQQFAGGMRTGSTQGPYADDKQFASGQRQFYAPPKNPYAGLTGAPQAAVAERKEQYAGSMTPGVTEQEWRGQMQRGADKKYDGPSALSDLDTYGKLAQDTAAAQDFATSLGAGNKGIAAAGDMNELDAALVGAAGRKRFEDLSGAYGGLKGELEAANVASRGEADAARAQTAANRSVYDALLKERDATTAAQAAADAGKNKPIVIGAASPTLGVTPEIKAAWEALSPEDRAHKLGSDRTYEQMAGMEDQFLVGTLKSYGIDEKTAQRIRDDLTPEEFVEYQRAVAQGLDAFMAWIQKMQAKASAA